MSQDGSVIRLSTADLLGLNSGKRSKSVSAPIHLSLHSIQVRI